MSPRMRFVGGPADGDVVARDEVRSHVLPRADDETAALPLAFYERTGRDDDGCWVMGWKPEGFDTKRDL